MVRLLSRCNDVGLLAEEFGPVTGHMLGNFPQAYSHVCAVLSVELIVQPDAHDVVGEMGVRVKI